MAGSLPATDVAGQHIMCQFTTAEVEWPMVQSMERRNMAANHEKAWNITNGQEPSR